MRDSGLWVEMEMGVSKRDSGSKCRTTHSLWGMGMIRGGICVRKEDYALSVGRNGHGVLNGGVQGETHFLWG